MNISRLFRVFALLLLLLSIVPLAGAQAAPAYTTIVVFGDSLSDTGNFARLTSNAYGVRIPGVVVNYTDGRFTDGPDTSAPARLYTGVWLEQLAAGLAAAPTVKASLDGGNDYAYGSATAASGTQVVTFAPGLSVTVQNTGAQIAAYLATRPVITGKTLFVVWAGANDLLQATTSAQVAAAAQADAADVQALITAGATDIIIPNLPPLGAIPRVNGNAASWAAATASTQGFNSALAQYLAALPAANSGKTLHLYTLDTYSLFSSILVSPTAYALANTTASAQGLAVNPDTYVFWDDLHPTTAVHRLLSLAARNLLTEVSGSSTTLTLGTATTAAGQPVSLKAVVAPAVASATVPTGMVTFYSGLTPIASTALDASGSASASLTAGAATGSPYSITAQYLGDSIYTPGTSAAKTLTVAANPVTTAIGISPSANPVTPGTAVTFTALATSAIGPPTGTVTFLDGTTSLGTVTLAPGPTSSSAAFTTSALAAGSHSITAVLNANSTYASSTSAVLTEVISAPYLTLSTLSGFSTATAQSGHPAAIGLQLTSYSGLAGGPYTFTCTSLPANASCTFSPSSVSLTANTSATISVIIQTSATTAANLVPALPGARPGPGTFLALLFAPCLALLARRQRRFRPLLMLAFSAVFALGLAGCGGSSTSRNVTPGTYQIQVNVVGAPAGSTTSAAVTLVVMQ